MGKQSNISSRRNYRRTALAASLAIGLGLSGQAFAQSTNGTIFGTAPASSGETVQITGGAGFNRTVRLDSSNRYSVTVPVGMYTVNLMHNGAVVETHSNISPSAGGAKEVDFTGGGANATNAQNLSALTVTANQLPAIDVTSTTQNLTITSQQLAQLPLARSGAAIALLAPGTAIGASELGASTSGESLLSFGGSSVVENAYYINGFNTSDPLSNSGGVTLPYGSIDQQQTLTSGYGAKYGRSAGGVISQIGKSGTNDWHFGAQALWDPAFAQSNSDNIYWNNPLSTQSNAQYKTIQTYQKPDSSWTTTYDAYVGGPLIKDKLFIFLSAEADKSQGTVNRSVNLHSIYHYKQSNPKFYGKVDWNINDSNILSVTHVQNQHAFDPRAYYKYDNTTHQQGAFTNLAQRTKNTFSIWSATYTSYITDNLTLDVLYGKEKSKYYAQQAAYPGYDPTVAHILSSSLENPAYAPNPVHTTNNTLYQTDTKHNASVTNLRVDLDWKLGNHDIQFGIDNDTAKDSHDGQTVTGPGYAWEYGQTGSAAALVPSTTGTGNPCVVGGATVGCYVSQYVFTTAATVRVMQRAQYIQDNWQITPDVLLNIGVRNDQFTNYNPNGVAYLRLTKPQWAPRLGFSWDVLGDSTLKVFGNAGRYYLAMPASVALRAAGAPLYSQQYFNYTGITPDGLPINPQLVPTTAPGGITYINGENGTSLNPKLISSKNLKAEYQDQFVLGMQQQFKMLGQKWVYGATGIENKLGRAIDDVYASLGYATYPDGTPYPLGLNALAIQKAATAQGVTIDPSQILGSVLINPGTTNTLTIPNGSGGYSQVKVSPADFGFPPVKRKYYSLDLYLEHPFDGKWFGKIDYVFSRSYGDTEGPVQSNIGQGGSSQSATEQWDFAQIMSYSNGLLANDQKHQFRIYGSYAVSPEWMLGATYMIASGHPKSCLGLYGPGQTDPAAFGGNTGYGSSYHYCNGVPTPTGTTGFTPWTHLLNLQVDYRPAFAQHKLDFSLQVHNAFNEQNPQQYESPYNNGANAGSYNPNYNLPYSLEGPRYVQMGVRYDY